MKTLAVSERATLAKPSPTLAISAKANAMKAAGIDVVSFGAGEPDFSTPEPICEAAHRAIEQGRTKYTPTSGIPELRAAIAEKLQRENGIETSPEQIVVSCGAKQSLYNSAMMLLNPGDEAIVLAPYWMTYIDQIQLASGLPVVCHTRQEDDFLPDAERIAELIRPNTKAIFVNSPCNPTGAVYPRERLEAIANVAVKHGLWLICDEIYERLVYGATHVSTASLGSEIAERTITIGGCSKTFAMTGWRIGYASAPIALAKTMAAFQDSVTSNPNSVAQWAALEAFKMSGASIEAMRSEFEQRRDLMRAELLKIPKLGLSSPKGAFYFLVDVSAYFSESMPNDERLVQCLLESASVATVPGSVFGAPGFIRLSYTASQESIRIGIGRIANFLASLS